MTTSSGCDPRTKALVENMSDQDSNSNGAATITARFTPGHGAAVDHKGQPTKSWPRPYYAALGAFQRRNATHQMKNPTLKTQGVSDTQRIRSATPSLKRTALKAASTTTPRPQRALEIRYMPRPAGPRGFVRAQDCPKR